MGDFQRSREQGAFQPKENLVKKIRVGVVCGEMRSNALYAVV